MVRNWHLISKARSREEQDPFGQSSGCHRLSDSLGSNRAESWHACDERKPASGSVRSEPQRTIGPAPRACDFREVAVFRDVEKSRERKWTLGQLSH